MSLFGNLFPSKDDNASASLFSDKNPFSSKVQAKEQKRQAEAVEPALNAAIDELLAAPRTDKKRRRQGAEPDQQQDTVKATKRLTSSKEKVKKGKKAAKAAHAPDGSPSPAPGATGEPADGAEPAAANKKAKTAKNDKAGAGLAVCPSPSKAAKRLSKQAAQADPAGAEPASRSAAALPTAEASADDDAGAPEPKYTSEQLQRTVFVGNVAARVSRKKIQAFFSQCGKVESVRLRNVPVDMESKMPKVHQIKAGKIDGDRAAATAYVLFAEAAGALQALALNMTMFEGLHVRVDKAAAPSKKDGAVQYEPKRSVFVGNLPFNIQDEDLILKFNVGTEETQLEAAVEAVRVVKDGNSAVGKGFAYVLFKSRTAALAALNLNGSECKGRKIRVMRVKASAGGPGGAKVYTSGVKGRGKAHGGQARVAAKGKLGSEFLGVRTKGKGKPVAKSTPAAAGVSKKGAPPVAGKSKRPALLARKAKQLLELGRMSAADAKQVIKRAQPKKFKKGPGKGAPKRRST